MRKEIKYEITYQEYQYIKHVLDMSMKKDIHGDNDGEYTIRSMYFDNHLHEIENDKEEDINSVKKYRIRMYNNDASTLLLERKSNENGYMEKIQQKIEKADVENILNGNYMKLMENKETLKTELYLRILLKQFRPVIVIEYTRRAYRDDISKASVTIDREIKSTNDCTKFFEEINREDSKKYILEVKYESYIPEYIKNIIANIENKKITRAKFITQIKKYNYKE